MWEVSGVKRPRLGIGLFGWVLEILEVLAIFDDIAQPRETSLSNSNGKKQYKTEFSNNLFHRKDIIHHVLFCLYFCHLLIILSFWHDFLT